MPTKTASKLTPKIRHSPMEHPRHQYPQETKALQEIAQSCGLNEEIKWGKPCYTVEGKNIVLIQRFNEYVALLFFKGALLKDPKKLLSRVGEQQAPRQLRFRTFSEITRLKPTIRAYIEEAIDLEKSGAKVALKTAAEYKIPDELQTRLNTNPALKKAFAALTPGRQKNYIFQIAAAKQSTTRASRVEKYIPQILAGKGLND
jgi:uncharacterized protein YdeI (YjbR/CyaY-like superfamily)